MTCECEAYMLTASVSQNLKCNIIMTHYWQSVYLNLAQLTSYINLCFSTCCFLDHSCHLLVSESGLQYTPHLFIPPNSFHCEWQYKWQNISELHMLTDPIPQPVPATTSHLTVQSTYSCCWGAVTSLLFPLQKYYTSKKDKVATMLRFSIPIQYIQAVQFVPNNMHKSQNLRELSNRLTCSDMGSVPIAENYIEPLFMGNKCNTCTNNYGTLIYEFNHVNC